MVKNGEMNLKHRHVDKHWEYNQTGDAGGPMTSLVTLLQQ